MSSKPVEQAITGLLSEAAAATAKLDWTNVASLADAALKLDPNNADALTFKLLAADGTDKASDKQTLEQEIQEARKARSWEQLGTPRRKKANHKVVLAIWAAFIIAMASLIMSVDWSGSSEPSPDSRYLPHINNVNASSDCSYLNEHWIDAKKFVAAKHDSGISAPDEIDYMGAVAERMDEVGCS
jgi:hypothetical protein